MSLPSPVVDSGGIRVSIYDLIVLYPLEIEPFPFSAIINLLGLDDIMARFWFERLDVSEQQVLLGLKRSISAGLITCHGDYSELGPLLANPTLAEMREAWYALTDTGKRLMNPVVPWIQDVRRWTFSAQSPRLTELVADLRSDPLAWWYGHTHSGLSLAEGLGGWESHRAVLGALHGDRIVSHMIDRSNNSYRDLLQGHFRPDFTDAGRNELDHEETMPRKLTKMERMVLDVLQDDVESIVIILEILNHADAAYRLHHSNQSVSREEIVQGLSSLVHQGLVIPYGETREHPIRLRPLSAAEAFFDDSAWFGLSKAGYRAASRISSWS